MTGLCETHFRFNLGNGFYQWDEIKIRKQHIFVDYEFNFSFFLFLLFVFLKSHSLRASKSGGNRKNRFSCNFAHF